MADAKKSLWRDLLLIVALVAGVVVVRNVVLPALGVPT